MLLLPTATIHALHAATLTARLSREALVSGLDARFVSGLKTLPNHSEHILSDLNELNAVERLADGTVPLKQWLSNAVALAGPRREGEVFEAALKTLLGDAGSQPRPAEPRQESGDGLQPRAVAAHGTRDGESPVRVFVAAAPEDARYVEMLERHLASRFRKSTELSLWHRGKLLPAEDIEARTRKEIAAADVALVFLSADAFFDKDASADIEALVARMSQDALRVVPVLARPCDWKSTALGHLQPLPSDLRPISSQRNADEAYTGIVGSIGAIFKDLRDNKRAGASPRGEQT